MTNQTILAEFNDGRLYIQLFKGFLNYGVNYMNLSISIKLCAFTVVLFSIVSTSVASVNAAAQSCPMPSDEKLVCSVIMCVPGLLISESRPKCLQINRRFAIYLATLGFWKKPPSCKMRDLNCNVIGKAKSASIDVSFCNGLSTSAEQNACKAALGQAEQGYCATFIDLEMNEACETAIAK